MWRSAQQAVDCLVGHPLLGARRSVPLGEAVDARGFREDGEKAPELGRSRIFHNPQALLLLPKN